MKFEDTNGNGIKDESEPALPNWTIRLSKSGMQVDSAVTNNAGGYSFQNLEPGIYTITEALQSGWAQTLPLSGTYRDTIFTGSNLTGRNFGNFKLGIISGIKFNDLNQNGIRDNGENGLANWKIRISGTRTDSNFTDGSGGFSFENLGVGTYVVSEVLQTGWIQTYPSNNGTYEFTTTSGSIFPNANFGNFQFGSVSGTVFNDFDGDGTKDAGELGVQNWKVKISGNRTDSILTTADGIYSFNQLTFGSYTVMQEVQNDWIQTLPVNNQPYSFIAQSGTILNNRDFGNFRLGSIAGMKFNDINGNGVKDVGETGMSNWLIRLNGAKTDSQLTDGNGVYQFNSLAGGTYSITEKLQSGWFQSIPASGSYSITMRSGLDTANVLFGNYLLGSISGFVFNDINSNGTFDSGENGIANWKLRISGTANETTMTDNGGNFTFPNLRIGNYTVTQILPSGWIQKFPASNGTYAVTISAGTISTGKNFGNFQLGIISGKIFNDINGNGIRESGEPGLENWKINLTGSATDSMMSDVDGNYIFDSLQLGSYQVSQTVQSGWIQSLPVSGGNYSVSVFSGTNASNRDFGNYQLGSISGIKFEDINGDGVKGTNEPVLSNWKIRLNGLRTDSMFTDGNGAYLFNNLAIGNYTVSEVLQNGWAQSLPPNGQYTLTVTSGLHLTNKNFGNYRYASLSGLKWNDINDNGIKDNGEPVLSGWKIYIAGPKNDSTTTNGSGHYSFQNLFVGTYSVSEQVQSGWVKTYPQGNHSITLRSGLDTSQVNFGNFQYGTISGKKWNDLDNDGILDNGETFLPNWKITLNGVRSETTLTNSNGEYSFGNLRGGNYSVGEISEIGWVQSFPSAGTHALSITSGTVHSSRNFGSHLLSSIQGTVYNDYNGNGMKDFGENPLSNRSIYLRGALNDTLMSDANGTFTFYYLTTANYTVSSQLPTGWIYTQPSDGDTTFNITQDGTIISNANIGMFQFGSIRGQVYNDLNSDGIRDSLDPFLSNWRIRIIGPKIDSVFSNGQGNYVFNNLPAGTYIISEALQSGWVHSAPPADTFSVKIFSGTNITQKDFGNFQLGEVRGKVFNDINADGVRDLNEPIVPNWKVYLSHNLLIVDSALTSDSGSYTFHNVFPNIYHISSEVRGDWKLTFPLSSFHTDTVKSGSILMENNFGIFQRGKISGAKFNDRNGNGIRDGGEPGIPNWKIYISGGVSDSLSTDGDGNYEFSLLDYGSYVMSEDMPAGWKRSYPPAPGIHLVSITSGANATGKIFGNYQFGTIGGTVYNDFNKNGVKDAGEEALQNRKVKITGVQNDSVFSNANGNFSFTNLELGNYTVTQVNPPQWQQTQPATNGYSVVINSGTNITGRNFGNFEPGKISGIIFEDANGNGIKDFGEPGLSQRKVLISGTKSDSLRTDANGFYHFTNLDTGQYVVSQPDSFGWSQSLPPNHGTYACYVQSSSNFIDRHFGNYRNASISGIKFNDLNANGNRESGEPPLANWKIYLVGPLPDSSRVDSALTNINGNYTFQNLAIGSYIVREERKTQWKQTFPANDASYFVVLQSGTSSSDKNFGNFKFVTISGMKFLDANGNHIRDENEPGLSGWKIRLQLGSQIIDSTNTNDEGSYTFRNISPSTYIVYEALQIGWLPTYPQNGVHIVTAMSGDSIVNTNFGNVRTNSISGLLFNDIDGDGLFDNGESTIENWKVYLNGPKFDSTLTNSNGVYSFGQLPQGTYIISEELRQGWKPTAPAFPGTYSLFVINGTDTSGLNFGNFELGIISGVKYNDLNGNGTRDFFDLPIRNWKIRLSGASSETTFTDSNGIYIFKNLNVGSYNVSEFSDSLWYQTSTPQSYSVTIASSGQRADNRNFGNFKYGRISGIVFGDENANGIRDPNELPLAGWKIYSSQGNRDSAISDAAGRYIFVRLRSGLDTLVAVPQDGYQQTYPDSTSGYLHIVQITSGFNGTDFHFGQKFIVSVKEEITGVPRIFQLFQNYPNPFNPSTAIKFSVDVASPTTLKLYNILGSEVAVLFNMIAEPGRYYTIQFNNENLNSGVYFYRLENGKKSSMRKLVIMK
ncbi:MAG: T9SS type A sorting domain-containing protein [Ignavibacteriales bacterium]|nr:T9SS type A sorting domain-containing protein [Ignavibacteriales bacterium]